MNQMHQSPRLNRFAAYETEGSKLEAEDIISSNRGVHEPIDSSKLPGRGRSELFHLFRFCMFLSLIFVTL